MLPQHATTRHTGTVLRQASCWKIPYPREKRPMDNRVREGGSKVLSPCRCHSLQGCGWTAIPQLALHLWLTGGLHGHACNNGLQRRLVTTACNDTSCDCVANNAVANTSSGRLYMCRSSRSIRILAPTRSTSRPLLPSTIRVGWLTSV